MTNAEWIQKTPELMKQYHEWLSNPMTKMAIAAVREIHRPIMPSLGPMEKPIETLAALFAEQAGIEAALNTLLKLDRMGQGGEEVEPDWSTRPHEGEGEQQ
jgi:hypothetical protein